MEVSCSGYALAKNGLLDLDMETIKQHFQDGHAQYPRDTLYLRVVRFFADKHLQKDRIAEQKQGLIPYLERYMPQVLSLPKAVVIPSTLQNNCQGCIKTLFNEVATAKNIHQYPHVYTLLLEDDSIYSQQYRQVQGWDSPNVCQQSLTSSQPYFYQGYNPKVYFLEKGKLKTSLQLTPDNEIEALKKIADFGKQQ